MSDLLRVFDNDPDDLEVHPLAAMFPMLSDEELDDLAADIAEKGLLHPIVCTTDGRTIVDGRNRYEACKRAGVAPWFENRIENEEQARNLIVSANLQRRNLTKGQQAMALAIIYPEPGKGGRGHKGANSIGEFSGELLRQARFVLRMAPEELVPQVMSGNVFLDAAYAEATKRKQAASGTEAQMARLRDTAPDLADLVTEERMSLGEATAAANQRVAERQQAIEAGRRASIHLLDFCTAAVTIKAAAELGERGLVTLEQLDQIRDATVLLCRVYEGESDES